MTRKNKSPPLQTSLFDAFDAAAFAAETAQMPSAIEEAMPYYHAIIERYHAAITGGDPKTAAAIEQEAENLAIRLNGGTRSGIKGDREISVCAQLERGTAAPKGAIPLWGQTGEFTVEVNGCKIRIEFEGLYGICIPQFSANAVDYEKPFLSETGYRSFMQHSFECTEGDITVDRYVQVAIEAYIAVAMKGKLVRIQDQYRERHEPPRSNAPESEPS